MCGRYFFSTDESDDLRSIARDAQRRCGQADAALPAALDILPSQTAPVMICRGGKLRGDLQIFGIPAPGGSGLILNARAESVTQKPLFSRNIADQRCVIPAAGFYEWDAAKRQYLFTLPGEKALYLAGIYDNVDGVNHFVILTTEPNQSVQAVHHRMPLVLRREQLRPWLTDPVFALQMLAAVPPLLDCQPCDGQLSFWD